MFNDGSLFCAGDAKVAIECRRVESYGGVHIHCGQRRLQVSGYIDSAIPEGSKIETNPVFSGHLETWEKIEALILENPCLLRLIASLIIYNLQFLSILAFEKVIMHFRSIPSPRILSLSLS